MLNIYEMYNISSLIISRGNRLPAAASLVSDNNYSCFLAGLFIRISYGWDLFNYSF